MIIRCVHDLSLSQFPLKWTFFCYNSDYGTVEVAEARAFMERCMVATGVTSAHASALAEVLACADHRGHYSHGMNRLGESEILF